MGLRGAAVMGCLTALLITIALVVLPSIHASGSVTANITFNTTSYFPRSTALIILNDTNAIGQGTLSITINSTTCTTPQTRTLAESAQGSFNATIQFITSGTCNSTHILVADGDEIYVRRVDNLTDGATVPVIVNRSFFNFTRNAAVVFNFTSLGTGQTGNITVFDNDTAANNATTIFNTVTVTVNSTNSTANITVTLNETSASAGIFSGIFTLNASGNGSSGTVLGVLQGTNITVTYNDTLDDDGSVNATVNSSKVAQNGTISSGLAAYFPGSTVVIIVNDTDLDTNTSLADTINVTVNATNGQMITLTLTETNLSTGGFQGNFSFSTSSSNTTRTLFATDRNTVNVTYNDTLNFSGGNFSVNATAVFFNRTSGSVSTDASIYATNSTVVITVIDNDTCIDGIDPASCANKDQGTADTVRVFANSTSHPGGISFTLAETGVTTGNFTGNFTFHIGGASSSATRVLNVSNSDNLTITYTDSANNTGTTRNVSVTATFFTFTTGVFRLNTTTLNTTDSAFNVNQTGRINLTDTDSNANTNTSAADNVSINITSPTGCTITFNLTETGVNTGIFDNTFLFSYTACSNSTRTINVTPGSHNILTLNYLDAKNGTSSNNITVVNTTLLDDRVPSVTRLVSIDDKVVWRIGDTIRLNLTIDQPGGNISANFSEIDSNWTVGAEHIAELGNNSYRINYTIAANNTLQDGVKTINITIRDGVGNGPIYTTTTLKLSRITANTSAIDFGQFAVGQPKTALLIAVSNSTVNQSTLSEHVSIFKRYNFSYHTTANDSRLFYFMVPENTTALKVNVTVNDSTVNLTVIVRNAQKVQISGVPAETVSVTGVGFLQVFELHVKASNVSAANIRPIVDAVINASFMFRSNASGNAFPSGNTTIQLNLSLPVRGLLPQEFNGTIEYNNTNTSVTLNISYNITAPQMWLDTNWSSPVPTYPNGTVPITVNVGRGNKSIFLTINNTGNTNLTTLYANLTGNFTSSLNRTINITNVSVGTGITLASRNNMSFDPLAPNTFTNITITFNTSEQTTADIYNTSMVFNSTNGQPYNLTRINLSVNLTLDLNVTVLNVTHNSTTSNPSPNTNITINVSVKFQEGEPVTTLNASNFTIYDLTNTSQTYTIQGFNTSMNLSGIYWFNITTPSIAAGKVLAGIHNMYVEARGPDNNKANGSFTYNLTAPNFTVTPPSTFSLSASASASKTFTITNNGTANITNVQVNVTTGAGSASGNTTLSSLAPGTSSTVTITVTAPASATTYNVIVNASAGSFFSTGTVAVTMSNSSNASSSDSSSSTTTTAKTFAHAVAVVSFTDSLSAKLGENNVTVVTINNSGNLTLTTKLNLSSDDPGLSFSTTPSACLIGAGVTCTINATITVAETALLGAHAITLKAYKADDSAVSDTKTLTFTVLATAERAQQISITSENISAVVLALAADYNTLVASGLISAENASKVGVLVNESLALLTVLNASLASGDYITAESALLNLTTLSDQIKERLVSLKEEKVAGETQFVGSLGIWIVIGAVAAGIVGVVFYMLLPSGGYNTKLGYNPRQSFFYRMRGKLKRRKRQSTGPRFSRRLSRLVEQQRRSRPYKKGRFSPM